jgi:zinc transport system ATP-binding protein
MPVTPPLISAHDLGFTYQGNHILHDVTFSIEPGSYVGIIGPNGAGKTTLIKLILGLLEPTSGSLEIFGEVPRKARTNGRIGYVPQRISQSDTHFPATAWEIVSSGLAPQKYTSLMISAKDATACERAMELTSVSHLRDRLIGTLSGGEKQRVFIARALVSRPQLLILDEPTTGVDIASQEQFYDLLKNLNEKHNVTILYVSHDIEVMTKHAKSVLCINQTILTHCSPDEFIHGEAMTQLYGKGVHHMHHHHH